LAPALTNEGGRYVEPFLGGGSVFFSVECERALLSDLNEELINAYRAVRDQPRELITLLNCLWVDKMLFAHIRAEPCVTEVAKAARMLYLNRTAFNGLYRVNRRGEFNVPFGCKPGTQMVDAEDIMACSSKLASAELIAADFRLVLRNVSTKDTVFIDPPYTVKHDTNGFRRYNEQIFCWQDQLDLAAIANQLADAGVKVVVTNASHKEVLALYQKTLFNRCVVNRVTNMAARSSARGLCQEALLLSTSASAMWPGKRNGDGQFSEGG
jgi:DNA adenine methylase